MILNGHHIAKCRACETIVSRCRCPGPHEVRWVEGPCPNCKPIKEVSPT